MKIQDAIQHTPEPIKTTGDLTAAASSVAAVFATINPIAEFVILIATGVWIYFRVQDLRLSSKIKQKELDK